MTLWEEDIGKLSMSKSYRFEKVVIREYKGEAYLSTAASTTIMTIEDLDVRMTGVEEFNVLTSKIENAMIIGVVSFEKYSELQH